MKFCSLFSGSSGNSIYIGNDKTSLLVDAGMPAYAIENALNEIGVAPKTLDGILITHEHTDHISGVSALSKKYDIPVFANQSTWQAISAKFNSVKSFNIRIFQTGRDFYIQDFGIRSFKVSHDAAETVGFALFNAGRKVCIMTDLGVFPSRLLEEAAGSDIVLLESNHDINMLKAGRYPYFLKQRILSSKGHLSNDSAAQAAFRLFERDIKYFVLGHLSAENNSEALALECVLSMFASRGAVPGKDVLIDIAHRDKKGNVIEL